MLTGHTCIFYLYKNERRRILCLPALAALPCSPAGTSTNPVTNGEVPSSPKTILNWQCTPCKPNYSLDLDYATQIWSGGVSNAGAAACTPCNATATTGYSWRGLACNTT
jgi:hypothetical protein